MTAVALVCALTTAGVYASNKAAPAPETSAPMPFEPSEELLYEAEFSRLLLRGIKIAELKFTSGRVPSHTDAARGAKNADTAQAGRAAAAPSAAPAPLLFTSDVVSRGWFRKLFGINFRHRVESLVDPQSFSVLRTVQHDEQGKRVRASEAVFDREAKRVTWTERDPNDAARPPRVVNNALDGPAHDIVTAIYFLRTQRLAPGQSFELTVSDSGRVYRVPFKVFAEKKPFKSVVGRVNVVRVEVGMFGAGRLVEEEGKMMLWVTNDARRLPVRARLSNNLGTLDITLKSASGGARRL